MRRVFRYGANLILLVVLLFFSYLMLRISIRYLPMRSDIDFLQTKQNIYHKTHWRLSFYTHVFTSIFVLIAGLTQFNTYFQKSRPKLHRAFGYTYVVIVLFISGPAAFIMGIYANGGIPAQISFTLLATIWMTFTAMAWYYAVKRNFDKHRAFMLRSYALTLSAIALRIYTVLFAYFNIGIRPVEIYIMTAWLSWVPNLLIAELLINWRKTHLVVKSFTS